MKLIHLREARNHMATTFEFLLSCTEKDAARASRALARAHEMVAQLERELSEFLAESPIYLLNAAAVGERIEFSEAGIELLDLSARLHEETRGTFSATAKSPGSKGFHARLSWDRSSRLVWKLDAKAHLGFGAIGKGFALDRARAIIEADGFTDYLLSGGGSSVLISGYAGPRDPWRWAWSWKRDGQGRDLGLSFQHSSGSPIALGISGTHEKGAHLIHPADGNPLDVASAPASALVAHASAARADALSTALFVSGWESAQGFLRDAPIAPAATALIGHDEKPRWDSGFQRLWGSVGALALIFAASLGNLLLSVAAHAADAAATAAPAAEDAVDLSAGADAFTPYVLERNRIWILLPLLTLFVVVLHLKKTRKPKRIPR